MQGCLGCIVILFLGVIFFGVAASLGPIIWGIIIAVVIITAIFRAVGKALLGND